MREFHAGSTQEPGTFAARGETELEISRTPRVGANGFITRRQPRVLSAASELQGRIPPYRPLTDSSSHLGDAGVPGPGAVLAPVLDGLECSDGHDHQAAIP